MEVQQRVQKAQEFLAVSDAEFAKGDDMQASEKLWGAAAHAVMAVAQQVFRNCSVYQFETF